MRKHTFHIIEVVIILSLFICSAYAFNLPKWFPFNEKGALNEWQEKVFKDKVLYSVDIQGENGYLSAKSDKACSGLLYRIKFHPREFPMISWKWKVIKFPAKEKLDDTSGGWIERDDYAARVYVIFSGWNLFKIQSLEYIWDDTLPEGTVIASPYFKGLKLIVVESGRKNVGKFVKEERNIYNDYNLAFGRPPRRRVTAIAIMTDSDNTISTAEAYYKDIRVGYKK